MDECRGAPPAALKGLVTEAHLAQAEEEWPGLKAFLEGLPPKERPPTFLDLVWRFECSRARRLASYLNATLAF
jgi:hypothetical protein